MELDAAPGPPVELVAELVPTIDVPADELAGPDPTVPQPCFYR